eukprot:2642399-Rhodomonas_salina.1
MLFERSGAAASKKSMPRGMLKTANWSGIAAGLTHIDAPGAHSWSNEVLKAKTLSAVSSLAGLS